MSWWHKKSSARLFKRVGRNCVLPEHPTDIKGHIELGDACVVRDNVTLRTHFDGKILVGDGCEIADYAMISANALVQLGANAYIGPFTVLRDNNHLFQGTEAHWRLTPLLTQPIIVGANAYIGAGCYIMPGVTIGEGAVIAPRTTVTKDVGPLEYWAGSPAIRVGHRLEESMRSRLKRHQELMALFAGAQASAPAPEKGEAHEP